MAMIHQKLKNIAPFSILLTIISVSFMGVTATSCSNGGCRLRDHCSIDGDCADGLNCLSSCFVGDKKSRCVRSSVTNQFKLTNNSLPFNKYAFLTTHNSFASKRVVSPRKCRLITFINQEDSVTQQLQNGVRALMLDTYDFRGDVRLCHSFKGKCHNFTAFGRAVETFKEIEAFLSANPSEVVTLILEDYVKAPNGLTNVFNKSGLMKFWFPLSRMPQNGEDWPIVKDMVEKNQRLVVFTSNVTKEKTEGIAYQWNYMVENQFGNDGLHSELCPNRIESSALNDRGKSLVLVNYFGTIPIKQFACKHNSEDLINMLYTCYNIAGNRWANFVAIDYYKRSDGGGAFQAVDTLNGKLICGHGDVHKCVVRDQCNFFS